MQFNTFFIFKIGLEAILFLYAVFAFVVLTQIRTMNKLITQPPIGGILEIVGLTHLILAISLFLLGLAIL